jgi:hypothetical protein
VRLVRALLGFTQMMGAAASLILPVQLGPTLRAHSGQRGAAKLQGNTQPRRLRLCAAKLDVGSEQLDEQGDDYESSDHVAGGAGVLRYAGPHIEHRNVPLSPRNKADEAPTIFLLEHAPAP